MAKKKLKKDMSKMECMVIIFEKEFVKDNHKRKDCLKKFMKECDVSVNYASTAYQSIKTRWLEDEMN